MSNIVRDLMRENVRLQELVESQAAEKDEDERLLEQAAMRVEELESELEMRRGRRNG